MTIAKLVQTGIKTVTTATPKVTRKATSKFSSNFGPISKDMDALFKKYGIEKCKLPDTQWEKIKEQARKNFAEMCEKLKK